MVYILLIAAIRSLVLASIVGGAFVLLRVHHPFVKKAAWAAVLATAFAMPLLGGHLLHVVDWKTHIVTDAAPPQREVESTFPVSIPSEEPSPRAILNHADFAGSEEPRQTSTTILPASDPSPAQSPLIDRVLNAIYGLVAALLLLRIVFGCSRALRIWRSAEPYSSLGLKEVRLSGKVTSPCTFGSGVLLPMDAVQWSSEDLSLVLAHERMHVRQGDFYLQMAARIYTALFWFSPLGWWLQRECVHLGERTSDYAALKCAPNPESYADLLLRFSSGSSPAAAVGMASCSRLRSRIDLIFAEGKLAGYFAAPGRSVALAALLLPVAVLAATVTLKAQPTQSQTVSAGTMGTSEDSVSGVVLQPVASHTRNADNEATARAVAAPQQASAGVVSRVNPAGARREIPSAKMPESDGNPSGLDARAPGSGTGFRPAEGRPAGSPAPQSAVAEAYNVTLNQVAGAWDWAKMQRYNPETSGALNIADMKQAADTTTNNPALTPEFRADLLSAHQQYAEAIAAYSRIQPQTADIYNKIGFCYEHLSMDEDAKVNYNHAIKLDKKLSEAYNNLGTVYFHEKNIKKAERLYNRAIKLDPQDAFFWGNLGTVYLARQHYSDGVEAFDHAISLDHNILEEIALNGIFRTAADLDRAKLFFTFAQIYAQAGQKTMAIEYLRKAFLAGYHDRDSSLLDDQRFASIRTDPQFQQLLAADRQK